MDVLAETLKGLTIDSTINDFSYYDSGEDESEGEPKRDLLLATHNSDRNKIKVNNTDTTNRYSPQKLLINRTVLMIILPIDP